MIRRSFFATSNLSPEWEYRETRNILANTAEETESILEDVANSAYLSFISSNTFISDKEFYKTLTITVKGVF